MEHFYSNLLKQWSNQKLTRTNLKKLTSCLASKRSQRTPCSRWLSSRPQSLEANRRGYLLREYPTSKIVNDAELDCVSLPNSMPIWTICKTAIECYTCLHVSQRSASIGQIHSELIGALSKTTILTSHLQPMRTITRF